MKTPNTYLSMDELLKTEALQKLTFVSSAINGMIQTTLMGIPAELTAAAGTKGTDADVLASVGKRVVALAELKTNMDRALEAVRSLRVHAKPGPKGAHKGGRRTKAAAPVASPVPEPAPAPAPAPKPTPATKRKYKKGTKSALPVAPPGPKPAGYTGKGTRGGWRPNSGRRSETLKKREQDLVKREEALLALMKAEAERQASKKS